MHAFISHDEGMTHIDIRDDNGAQRETIKVNSAAWRMFIGTIREKYGDVEIVEQASHVTAAGWHHVTNHSDRRGWSTYLPGDTWDRGPWFDNLEDAISEANAQTG